MASEWNGKCTLNVFTSYYLMYPGFPNNHICNTSPLITTSSSSLIDNQRDVSRYLNEKILTTIIGTSLSTANK